MSVNAIILLLVSAVYSVGVSFFLIYIPEYSRWRPLDWPTQFITKSAFIPAFVVLTSLPTLLLAEYFALSGSIVPWAVVGVGLGSGVPGIFLAHLCGAHMHKLRLELFEPPRPPKQLVLEGYRESRSVDTSTRGNRIRTWAHQRFPKMFKD